MVEVKTASDMLQNLEELKTGLENHAEKQIKEQTKGMKADIEATVKGFDLLQMRMKNNPTNTPERLSLKSQVAESLDKNFDRLTAFIHGGTNTPLNIPIETKSTTLGVNYTGGSVALSTRPT